MGQQWLIVIQLNDNVQIFREGFSPGGPSLRDMVVKYDQDPITFAARRARGGPRHLFGRLDPNHSGTRRTLSSIGDVIDDIPAHRLTPPSTRTSGEAGMLAGMVTRLSGRPEGLELLNDALLFLQAREMGYAILTANVVDFELFDPLLPGSGLLLYRTL